MFHFTRTINITKLTLQKFKIVKSDVHLLNNYLSWGHTIHYFWFQFIYIYNIINGKWARFIEFTNKLYILRHCINIVFITAEKVHINRWVIIYFLLKIESDNYPLFAPIYIFSQQEVNLSTSSFTMVNMGKR